MPPTLPKSLLDTIGEYGMARTDRVSELTIQHRWELLIAAIKDYARPTATSVPMRRWSKPTTPCSASRATR